jgi:hypothetical protein
MQQSHSREHEHPKPDFALIGDTFVQDHQNSSSKYTIVDNCWDAGHCGNITKLPPKKRVLSHRTVMNSFPSERTKKLAKVGGGKILFTKGNLRQNILVCAKLSPK